LGGREFQQKFASGQAALYQYYYWLKGALRGDFGQSIFTRRDVARTFTIHN
jgi:ABC-type dipeptide/oligopeptide/nickel transport system permease component